MELLKSSQKQLYRAWVSDFSHFADIVSGLHYFFEVNTPASRIIKAVMFHRSLPRLYDWPNPVVLTDDEIRTNLPLADMDVLGSLMLGDSDAWNVCKPAVAYMEELPGNIAKVRNVFE